MQTFYMILGKDTINVYEKENGSYERVYLEGNPGYSYDKNNAKECIEKLFSMLRNKYNMDSVGEIDFVVIDNEDKIVSEVMERALSAYIKSKIKIEDLIYKIFEKLDRDKKLHISEYGVNFDGKNYLCREKKIEKHEFSLLGYTVSDDELIKYVN